MVNARSRTQKVSGAKLAFAGIGDMVANVPDVGDRIVVPQVRIELTTYPLPRDCATTTLLRQPWHFRKIMFRNPFEMTKGWAAITQGFGEGKSHRCRV